MAPVRNTRVLFNEYAEGYPIPGKTLVVDKSETIDLEGAPLKNGQVLVKTIAISVDPYQRGRMSEPGKTTSGDAYELGKPLVNYVVVKVIRSENPDFAPGQHVYGMGDFSEYQILTDLSTWKVLPETRGTPWSAYVGVLGMPGQTAFYGWKEAAHAKKGETIYISTAAGAVGSMVVQIAKADGLKVIASAGTESKLQFLRELGADVVFNYKTTNVEDVLKEHGPIDIYWDNAGGKSLDAALANLNTFGRVVKIGSISSYNSKPEPIYNTETILWKRIIIRGVLVFDHHEQYLDEFYATFPPKVAKGEIKYVEHVVRSLDETPQLVLDQQKGNNTGKAVIVLADE
ncbi:NAD(P)-binding protein [Exidia glandulosa HHB12029]|uniref:NAD(P)-binding protein n=1 Tax=Exidia glandulosa HHB12029 TaxID=1314781 RepID=A0A165KBD3_EXIGL|nr:NAD(P)-binding protein [Exidia glandulosa HHB12029]